jgi:uncharacterized membrane protein YphA (DoxX/SURF4 family)
LSLFLLRLAAGAAAMFQGWCYLTDPDHSGVVSTVVGLMALAAGVLILIGFLTPVAGVVVALGASAIGLSLLPVPVPTVFDEKLSIVLVLIITIAVVFLGPGAFSVDARLFGRREIIIPPFSRSSR